MMATTVDKILQLCDEFLPGNPPEYFFDRNPVNFPTILNMYRWTSLNNPMKPQLFHQKWQVPHDREWLRPGVQERSGVLGCGWVQSGAMLCPQIFSWSRFPGHCSVMSLQYHICCCAFYYDDQTLIQIFLSGWHLSEWEGWRLASQARGNQNSRGRGLWTLPVRTGRWPWQWCVHILLHIWQLNKTGYSQCTVYSVQMYVKTCLIKY